MNITESNGESSYKGQENGDAHNGSERPLKKARFAWQVKGKYHLKNEIPDPKDDSVISTESNVTGSSNEIQSNNKSEQNLEILEDYLLQQNLNTLESVITETNNSVITPSSSVPTENRLYPRYISTQEINELNQNRSSIKGNETISFPMSIIFSKKYAEDQCIARWQARQIAKGFLDNRINQVLDSWIHAPSSEETSGFVALEVAEFINNLPGANSIENEGILMAISAHGLQNTDSSNNIQNYDSSSTSLSGRSQQSEDEDDIENCISLKSNNVLNDLEIPWSDNNHKDSGTQFSLFPDAAISYQCVSESKESINDLEGEVDNNGHYDYILDEAVLLAIHNKGLTTSETDYG